MGGVVKKLGEELNVYQAHMLCGVSEPLMREGFLCKKIPLNQRNPDEIPGLDVLENQ